MKSVSRCAPYECVPVVGLALVACAISMCIPRNSVAADATTPSSASADTRDPTASSNSEESLKEVVVTAQRRKENLQTVPVVVEALSGDSVAMKGIVNSTSFNGMVGSLNVTTLGPQNLVYLRGVGGNIAGPNSELSIGTYVDGVYVYAGDQTEFPLNAIDQVEVLKGPQGTLFGRNATGGAILITTKDPTQAVHTEISAGYANYGTSTESLYATGGLTDDLAANIAVYDQNQQTGWGTDVTTGTRTYYEDDLDVRSKFLFTPGDNTRIIGTFSYADHHSGMWNPQDVPGEIGANGVVPVLGRFNTDLNSPTYFDFHDYSGSLRIEHDFGFARLTSTTAYDKTFPQFYTDADYTPANLVSVYKGNQYAQNGQQEFLLNSEGQSRLTWTLGGNLFWAEAGFYPIGEQGTALAPLPNVDLYAEQITRAEALFGQATLTLLPDTDLTTGLRYTHEGITRPTGLEESEGTLLTTLGHESSDFNTPTWRVALDHKYTEDVMAYVSYNRGAKSGGFNLLAPNTVPSYKPEKLDAYELGVKTEWLDHRLRFNAASFLYKYSNMQVQEITLGANETLNAAAATLYGVDTDFAANVTDHFTVDGSISYLHGRYTHYPNAQGFTASPVEGGSFTFDATGNTTVFSPEFSGNVGMTYSIPSTFGELRNSVSVTYQDSVYTQADNRLVIPGYALLNASIDWDPRNSDVWDVRLWANNVTDKDYFSSRDESATGDFQVYGAPRTFGVTVTARF